MARFTRSQRTGPGGVSSRPGRTLISADHPPPTGGAGSGARPPLLTVAVDGDDPVVVRLVGELDPATAPELDASLRTVSLDGPPLVHLDLGGVTFMDSSGIRSVLIGVELLARRGGRLRVVNAGPPIERILDVVGLLHLVDRR